MTIVLGSMAVDRLDPASASDAETCPGSPPVLEEQPHVLPPETRHREGATHGIHSCHHALSDLQFDAAINLPKSQELQSTDRTSDAFQFPSMLPMDARRFQEIGSRTSQEVFKARHAAVGGFPWASSCSQELRQKGHTWSTGLPDKNKYDQSHQFQFLSREQAPNKEKLARASPLQFPGDSTSLVASQLQASDCAIFGASNFQMSQNVFPDHSVTPFADTHGSLDVQKQDGMTKQGEPPAEQIHRCPETSDLNPEDHAHSDVQLEGGANENAILAPDRIIIAVLPHSFESQSITQASEACQFPTNECNSVASLSALPNGVLPLKVIESQTSQELLTPTRMPSAEFPCASSRSQELGQQRAESSASLPVGENRSEPHSQEQAEKQAPNAQKPNSLLALPSQLPVPSASTCHSVAHPPNSQITSQPLSFASQLQDSDFAAIGASNSQVCQSAFPDLGSKTFGDTQTSSDVQKQDVQTKQGEPEQQMHVLTETSDLSPECHAQSGLELGDHANQNPILAPDRIVSGNLPHPCESQSIGHASEAIQFPSSHSSSIVSVSMVSKDEHAFQAKESQALQDLLASSRVSSAGFPWACPSSQGPQEQRLPSSACSVVGGNCSQLHAHSFSREKAPNEHEPHTSLAQASQLPVPNASTCHSVAYPPNSKIASQALSSASQLQASNFAAIGASNSQVCQNAFPDHGSTAFGDTQTSSDAQRQDVQTKQGEPAEQVLMLTKTSDLSPEGHSQSGLQLEDRANQNPILAPGRIVSGNLPHPCESQSIGYASEGIQIPSSHSSSIMTTSMVTKDEHAFRVTESQTLQDLLASTRVSSAGFPWASSSSQVPQEQWLPSSACSVVGCHCSQLRSQICSRERAPNSHEPRTSLAQASRFSVPSASTCHSVACQPNSQIATQPLSVASQMQASHGAASASLTVGENRTQPHSQEQAAKQTPNEQKSNSLLAQPSQLPVPSASTCHSVAYPPSSQITSQPLSFASQLQASNLAALGASNSQACQNAFPDHRSTVFGDTQTSSDVQKQDVQTKQGEPEEQVLMLTKTSDLSPEGHSQSGLQLEDRANQNPILAPDRIVVGNLPDPCESQSIGHVPEAIPFPSSHSSSIGSSTMFSKDEHVFQVSESQISQDLLASNLVLSAGFPWATPSSQGPHEQRLPSSACSVVEGTFSQLHPQTCLSQEQAPNELKPSHLPCPSDSSWHTVAYQSNSQIAGQPPAVSNQLRLSHGAILGAPNPQVSQNAHPYHSWPAMSADTQTTEKNVMPDCRRESSYQKAAMCKVSRRLKSHMLVRGQSLIAIPSSDLPCDEGSPPQLAYLPVDDPTTAKSYILCNFCKSDKIFMDVAGLVRHLESGDCPVGHDELCRVRASSQVLRSTRQTASDGTNRFDGSSIAQANVTGVASPRPSAESKWGSICGVDQLAVAVSPAAPERWRRVAGEIRESFESKVSTKFTRRGISLESMRPYRQVQRKLGKATTKLKYLRELQRISPQLFCELGCSIRGLLNRTSSELARILADTRDKQVDDPSHGNGNDSDASPHQKVDFPGAQKTIGEHAFGALAATTLAVPQEEHWKASTCRNLLFEVERSAPFALADCRSKFLEQDLQLEEDSVAVNTRALKAPRRAR